MDFKPFFFIEHGQITMKKTEPFLEVAFSSTVGCFAGVCLVWFFVGTVVAVTLAQSTSISVTVACGSVLNGGGGFSQCMCVRVFSRQLFSSQVAAWWPAPQ